MLKFLFSCCYLHGLGCGCGCRTRIMSKSPPRLKRRNSMKKKSRNTMKRSQLEASSERIGESSARSRGRARIMAMAASEEPAAAKLTRRATSPDVRRSQSQLLPLPVPDYFSNRKSIRRSRSNTLKYIFMRSESPTVFDANSSRRNSKDLLSWARRSQDDPLVKESMIAVVPEVTVNTLSLLLCISYNNRKSGRQP